MSQRIQTITEAVEGNATTTGFVNVYQESDGKIQLGSRTFRQRRNAERKGAAYRGPLTFLKTVEVHVEESL